MKKSHLLLILFVLLLPFVGVSQQDSSATIQKKLKIGIFETPPFVMHNGNKYSGLSVDSWKLVNNKLNADYTFETYDSLGALLDAVENGEVDFSINPVTVTDNRMKRMAFTQPYFISHTAIAKKKESNAWAFIQNLWSWKFFSAIFALVAILFLFGFLVWLFERKHNEEEFGGSKWRGLKEGFWWSAVTMTTVGYGDRSPRTTGGRIVGLIWMFTAIIMISSLTAGIASSLTVQSMNSKIKSPEDLQGLKVTTISNSSAEELLDLYKVKTNKVENEKEGIQRILDKKTNFFVYDEPILNYEIKRRGLQDDIEVLSKTLKKDYYSYSFPKNSTLINKINPVLMGVLKSLAWQNDIENYQ